MIPIAKPYLDGAEISAVERVIQSGWITQGPEVALFESEFATFVGAEYACAVSNCTTGLHLALLAAGVKNGDEVITVSHSFIATANAVRYCGATPVFVDIQPKTFNIDPDRVAAAVTPLTRAIICVHQMGMPCDLSKLVMIADSHKLALIEDAACAIGSEILWRGRWEKIGCPRGDAACFSFHPRKILSTGDGGMITTKHGDWDRRFRLYRQHGMSEVDTVRHLSNRVIFENYPILGFNYRMTDIQAAIGREQLKKIPAILERRRKLVEKYVAGLGEVDGIVMPEEPHWARTNWQSYCCRLVKAGAQVDVMQRLLDRGVASRRGIMCAHREPSYAGSAWRSAGDLSESEAAQDQCILLPLFHQLQAIDQDLVISEIRNILGNMKLGESVAAGLLNC